jgi:hypothetical protein
VKPQKSTGYSNTPLAKKLGIAAGHRIALLGAPSGFEATLGALPIDTVVQTTLTGRAPFNVVLCFVVWRVDLERKLPSIRKRMDPTAGFWVAWPKKASGVSTDMSDNVIRETALPTGLVDNKVCAIDEIWSGLRLVIRLQERH